jgi:hypothetical protein
LNAGANRQSFEVWTAPMQTTPLVDDAANESAVFGQPLLQEDPR